MEIEEALYGIDPIKNFLETRELSEDPIEAKRIEKRSCDTPCPMKDYWHHDQERNIKQYNIQQ